MVGNRVRVREKDIWGPGRGNRLREAAAAAAAATGNRVEGRSHGYTANAQRAWRSL